MVAGYRWIENQEFSFIQQNDHSKPVLNTT